MADQRIKDLNDDYKAVLKTVNEIQREEEKLVKKNKKLSEEQEKQLKAAQKQLDTLTKALEKEKLKQKILKEESTELASIAKSFIKVTESTKKQLKGGRSYLSISAEIARESARKLRYEDSNTKNGKKQLSNIIQRESILGDIRDNQLMQAKATAKAEEDLRGSSFDAQRRELKTLREKGVLTKKQYELGLQSVASTEKMAAKEAQLLQLKQTQSDLNKELPESLQKALSFSKGLVDSFKKGGFGLGILAGLAAALVSAISKFKALDDAADKFNDTTKLAISQMGDLQERAKSVGNEFGNIGANATDFYNVVEATLEVFGDTARLSKEVTDSILVLNKNFGTTNKEAAEALQIVESIGGVTSETAANLLLQSTELARAADVAPAQVIKDISDAAELSYKFFRGNVDELFKQATNARRFGTNLKDVLATTEKLLDFESSISTELTASTFVGGQFNLTRARSLAAAGKEVEAQQEILDQIQRSGDFRNKDLFTQQALAEAANMEVSEINRLLNVREKLNSLSADQREAAEKAIEQGLDISEIDSNRLSEQVKIFQAQKEQQGQLANIENSFKQIASTLGSAFLPLIEAVTPMIQVIANAFGFVAKIFKTINESLATAVPFYAAIAVYSQRAFIFGSRRAKLEALVLARQKLNNVLNMVGLGIDKKRQRASIGTALANAAKAAFANPLAALGSLAILGGLTAAIYSATKVKPTGDAFIDPNGGPILTSPQEGTLFQGSKNDAGILAPPSALGGGGTDKLARSIERLEKAYMKGVQLNIDGRNVTSRLSNVVDSSTRNNFNLA